MTWTIVIIIGALVFIVLFFLVVDVRVEFHGPTTETSHETKAELLQSGLGWMPFEIPETASKFRLKHGLKDDKCWLTFRVPRSDLPSMLSAFRRCSPSDDCRPEEPIPTWWPQELRGNAEPFGAGYELYGSERTHSGYVHRAFIAVDQDSDNVWYWSGGWRSCDG